MNHDEHDAPTIVNDLPVTTDEAKEVKGGAQVDYFLRLQGVDGDVTSATRQPGPPNVSEIVVTKTNDSY